MPIEKPLQPFILGSGSNDPTGIPEDDIPIDVSVDLDDGGALVMLGAEEKEPEFGDNLAEYIDEDYRSQIANEIIGLYEMDERSRSEWKETYMKGMELLGLKFEQRTEPWNGACGVFHPLLSDSIIRFQAQTIQEVFPASGPAKVATVGKQSTKKDKQANRVASYLNYVATKQMKDYRNETEKLLFSLPLAGSAFRKIYYDRQLKRPASMFVPAEDYVVNYGASDMSTLTRGTHLMRRSANWVRKQQVSGFYLDIDLPEPEADFSQIKEKADEITGVSGAEASHDSDFNLLEMTIEYDLEGFEHEEDGEETGIGLPYVITVEKSTGKLLSIYRNWQEGDETYEKRDHVVHYTYLPGLGFYGFGLTHMIGGLSDAATSLLRQLVDSGTLANLPGGLKTRGLRIKGDDTPILPGEFRDVDVTGGSIKDNIAFLPYKEPSGVLYQLLQDIVNEGRRFASAADMKVGDMNGEAPVGTTLAILEREMKVLSAIQARIHNSMGDELRLLSGVIRDFGPEKYPYEVDGKHTITEDFDDRVDVIPVSDPNAGTMAQRIMQYQAALQLAATAPQIYDIAFLHRKMLEILGIENADKIVPTEDDLVPTDPITETQNVINGKPVKAFLHQDHESHIQVHTSAMQNPQMMESLQQHPNAKGIMAAGAAHIAEHVAFLFRQKVEQELGFSLPEDEVLPEDVEVRISKLAAPAVAQLTGKAQQQKQAEENAKKQEDPIVQMAQEELRQKGEKIKNDKELGEKKIQANMMVAIKRLENEAEKIKQSGMIEGGKLVAKVSNDQMDNKLREDEIITKQNMQGLQLGVELAQKILEGLVLPYEQSSGSDT